METFKTRKDAKLELAKMMGWDAKVALLYQPGDPNATRNGNVFVIEISGYGDPKYLRKDGYVR